MFTRTRVIIAVGLCAAVLSHPAGVSAQSFTEGFTNITLLTGQDWVLNNIGGHNYNQSSPLGSTSWFQGDTNAFSAQAGASSSYIAANFNNGGGVATISNWLILPRRTLQNGDIFTFYTRGDIPGNPFFADRLQVRLSVNGASTNTGSTATSVGDFTTLLLDIDPTYQQPPTGPCLISPPPTVYYPCNWAQYMITIGGLGGPTPGRFAFRYFVEGGGPDGDRSNYVGIDTVSYTAIPEPATAMLIASLLPGLLLATRRRNR